ncbi:MAG: hypothetical protein AAB355_00850, partial [Patescibacteria group bacterium]
MQKINAKIADAVSLLRNYFSMHRRAIRLVLGIILAFSAFLYVVFCARRLISRSIKWFMLKKEIALR